MTLFKCSHYCHTLNGSSPMDRALFGSISTAVYSVSSIVTVTVTVRFR